MQHQPRPEKCHGCGRKLRPSGRKLEDFPGTVSHNGNGLCVTCYGAEQRVRERIAQGKDKPSGQIMLNGEVRASTAENIDALGSFLARIKNRGPHARVPTPTA